MNPDDQLPDLYKLPPMEFQAYDDWKKDSNDDDDAPYVSEPEPDYSDDESSDREYEPSATSWQARKENLQDQLNILARDKYDNIDALTRDKYDSIVATAEANMETMDIPEPDYLDQEEAGHSPPRSPSYTSSIFTMPPTDSNGVLAEAKKLVNPCLESRERQQLHKELMLNQKMGIDVLHQKSELKKEMERRQNNLKKKELEEYHRHKRTSLEVKLEEQATKLKETDAEVKVKEKKTIPEEVETEFLKIHSKINRAKLES